MGFTPSSLARDRMVSAPMPAESAMPIAPWSSRSPFVGQRLTMLASKEHRTHIEAVRQFIEGGRVTPIIDRTYTLAEVPDAMRHLEAGKARGKIAITVWRPPGRGVHRPNG